MAEPGALSAHAAHNQALWDRRSADYQEAHGPQLERSGGAAWGVWQLPARPTRRARAFMTSSWRAPRF